MRPSIRVNRNQNWGWEWKASRTAAHHSPSSLPQIYSTELFHYKCLYTSQVSLPQWDWGEVYLVKTVGATWVVARETLWRIESRLPNFSPHFPPYFSPMSTSTIFPYSSNFLKLSTTFRKWETTGNSTLSLVFHCALSCCSNLTFYLMCALRFSLQLFASILL